MILKFCFHNEIHRCSEPPVSLDSLRVLIRNSFQTSLPPQFSLYYVNSEGQNIFLDTEEDYQAVKQRSNETIKIFISEKDPKSGDVPIYFQNQKVGIENNEYEVVLDSAEIQKEGQIFEVEEEKAFLVSPKKEQESIDDVFERLSDDMTKNHVIPQLQNVQNESLQPEQLKKMVKDILMEQMPYIISQVKETLVRENFSTTKNVSTNTQYEEQKVQPGQNSNNFNAYQPPFNFDQRGNMQSQPPGTQNMPRQEERSQPQGNNQSGASNQRQIPSQEKKSDFFDTMFDMLGTLSTKAVEALDNLSQDIEGDPYILCVEGKYPRSVVEKAHKLQATFPGEPKKNLLDFVKSRPKELNLTQLTEQFTALKNQPN